MEAVAHQYHPPAAGNPWIGFIEDVYLVPAMRKGGWGGKLVLRLEAELKKRGITHMELRVLSGNASARDFWRKMGYADYVNLMYKPLP